MAGEQNKELGKNKFTNVEVANLRKTIAQQDKIIAEKDRIIASLGKNLSSRGNEKISGELVRRSSLSTSDSDVFSSSSEMMTGKSVQSIYVFDDKLVCSEDLQSLLTSLVKHLIHPLGKLEESFLSEIKRRINEKPGYFDELLRRKFAGKNVLMKTINALNYNLFWEIVNSYQDESTLHRSLTGSDLNEYNILHHLACGIVDRNSNSQITNSIDILFVKQLKDFFHQKGFLNELKELGKKEEKFLRTPLDIILESSIHEDCEYIKVFENSFENF